MPHDRLQMGLERVRFDVSIDAKLIAALALEHDHQVYTMDEHFQRVPELRLHEVGVS